MNIVCATTRRSSETTGHGSVTIRPTSHRFTAGGDILSLVHIALKLAFHGADTDTDSREDIARIAVSYTHLTLPTILRV